MTVLLLAFVLVQVFASFKASRDASALEAGRTATVFDLIDYYDDEDAQPVQASLNCYRPPGSTPCCGTCAPRTTASPTAPS